MALKLNNNISIPVIGFGTFNEDLNNVYQLVTKAIDNGYRHFDTAAIYRNEEQVGQAINDRLSQLKREKLFITSKLPMNGFAVDKVEHFLDRSLKKLKLDYLDLYLMHAPFAIKYKSDEEFYPLDENKRLIADDVDFLDTWKVLEALYKRGRVKAIGVSNFNIVQLKRILENCEIKPMVNQIEVHVYFQNKELVEFCRQSKIQVCCFAALATPKLCSPDFSLKENKLIQELSKKYNKSWTQICLRFLTQQDLVTISAADDENQMKENIDSNSFDLDESDMKALKNLDKDKRIYIFDYAPGVLDHKEYPFKNENLSK